ncbi:Polynucleotidyl transferase, Ribonuclease H fold [Cucumis melo var. makuwa]|uniref:Polynucleotidyl transferase, Ribonuclease H fold n=1 Tax=Cucumis melo var. makuwa TaxID=1194695 RepID=A0A5A7VKX5_CUCMM|nr:Polynucleotidyl transferase, Ribonuclease H fold [Cucumis melo var. makuwa]TYK26331.1 Polynucleotidyl transferase, Ribonuclease H fold [Cucumis melo var. makuwa]
MTDETTLWHQRLGHNSLSTICKAISADAMLKTYDGSCFDCPIEKQTKAPHSLLGRCTTSKVLELIDLDLMSPMQIESLIGKSRFSESFDE